jgi:hypothetical protein
MSKIKLLKAGELEDGTVRFQSQLLVGTITADFIMGTDGVMKNYERGNKGFDFYPYNEPYEIVLNIRDMFKQSL